jgi:hypothetical protein
VNLFDSSYLYSTGLDTPPSLDDRLAAKFDEFYTCVHAPKVLAENLGLMLGHRYELIVPDDRGLPAPRRMAHVGAGHAAGLAGDLAARPSGGTAGVGGQSVGLAGGLYETRTTGVS